MAMTPASPRHNVMREFDQSMERMLGADMRLIYGMAVPLFMVTGLVALLALNPATWLVIAIIVLEALAVALILRGLLNMMDEDDEDDIG